MTFKSIVGYMSLAKNGDCQPIFVTHKCLVFNQSGHENRWLYPIFRAHCTSATGC